MNITIIYDSNTGKTRQAAQTMGKIFEGHGHQCKVFSLENFELEDVKLADLVCLGTWVKGLMIIKQHPTESFMQFLDELGNLDGKKVAVFCTYLLAAGSTLHQMSDALETNGAEVIASFKFRGPKPNSKFESFAVGLE